MVANLIVLDPNYRYIAVHCSSECITRSQLYTDHLSHDHDE